MRLANEVVSVLNSYLPEPYRIPEDRRVWCAVQRCAHIALFLIIATLVLCVIRWAPDSDLIFDWLINQSH